MDYLKLKEKLSKDNILKKPESPGIYVYLNENGDVIYVGKSVNLKQRLYSYLNMPLEPKTRRLMDEAREFFTINVNSELEALLLEAKLIKSFQPKYNIELKDDKHPLYIKITRDKYPLVLTARKIDILDNKSHYFGPFPSSRSVRYVLRYMRKIFPYAQHLPGKKPCIYNQIGLCNPCPSIVENEKDVNLHNTLLRKYKSNIRLINGIFNGNLKLIYSRVERQMKKASLSENYEAAIVLRQQLEQLKYISQPINQPFKYIQNPNLLIDIREKELMDLSDLLSKYINIKSLERIECYDVAHLGGTRPTASMVTFIKAEAEKSLYRRFKIYQKNPQDDFSSLKEVARRRRKHFADWGIPDLIVVDGGKGQVKVFYDVFKNDNILVVGLAKRFETLVIPAEIIKKEVKAQLPNRNFIEIRVPKGEVLNLLERIRNEAHRFARVYHHKLIEKEYSSLN